MWRRLSVTAGIASAAWLLAVWPPPVWWRTHWPQHTAMMRWADRRAGPSATAAVFEPTPLAQISPVLQELVVLAEDARFRTHWGIDPAELRDALGLDAGAGPIETLRALWRRRDRMRGASTITQQLAKNLYLSPSRNPLRKLKELATALRLEAALPKDRILELYLNVAELGPGTWGVERASRRYFAVPATAVSVEQAASLAATLPHPRTSNPMHRPGRMLARRELILARYHGGDVVIPPAEELELDPLPPVPVAPPLAPPGLDTLQLLIPTDTTAPDSSGAAS